MPAGSAFASTTLSFDTPDGYGSYLAGQQVLRDLSTGDAARYLRDASLTQWNNPIVVQRAVLAEAAGEDADVPIAVTPELADLLGVAGGLPLPARAGGRLLARGQAEDVEPLAGQGERVG